MEGSGAISGQVQWLAAKDWEVASSPTAACTFSVRLVGSVLWLPSMVKSVRRGQCI